MRQLRSLVPLVAALTIASPVLAGPPWISIETPVNPWDASTRGAFLLVHAFHHGTPVNFPVSGTAEGIVDGQRRSVPLRFERTSREGVYALKNLWGTTGEWSLILTVSQGKDDVAQAMVQVSGTKVLAVDVPTREAGEAHPLPRRFTQAEIDASLRGRVVAANHR